MSTPQPDSSRKTIVLIGHGMVGHRFCEQLVAHDQAQHYRVVTFCEEPRAAYDRVGLSSFFAHRDAEKLRLANLDWYREQGIELHVGDRAVRIDRQNRVVLSHKGIEVPYDHVVLATGSYPFVPNVPGITHRGVFVYRTIEDLERIIEYGAGVKSAAVIGGGLLGLEAAKAARDLGLETHVIEFAPRLMPRQIDEAGSRLLVDKIRELGVQVHLNSATQSILGDGVVKGVAFQDGTQIEVGMVIVSAGIRPRDDVAKEAGLELGPRGGVCIDDELRTSDPAIFAIGEVALHQNMIYGLVAPGYEMAEALARNLTGDKRKFSGSELSTKLKLMGIDVASFGQYELGPDQARSLTVEDPFAGVYKRLFFTLDGTRLLGGILVGDASDYTRLVAASRQTGPLAMTPAELMGLGGGAAAHGLDSLPDEAQICSCNNVSKQQICDAVSSGSACTLSELKACTRAGTGCGGCLPSVTDLLNITLSKAGKSVNTALCEHFAFTRQELFQIVKVQGYRTFAELLVGHGTGLGCEICKPTVGSILASLWNDQILEPEHADLQDTNDRFLANMQRGGLYSVVPRVPGGEITPDKLIVLGEVAKKYGLYTKITGGQRVDLFGAAVHELPQIWEELVTAGFESGHAYGKALRTVKSCVGTTWCRYGIGDSVGFAIRIENRYKGLRSPHKLKGAVSGCIRECAEAQSKDFGLIATEKGYNLYVCGNGGSKPRHADLLAADLSEDLALKYIDRFLMYYVQTADRLMRTSVWLDKLPGGIEALKKVVLHDQLGICDELERQMQAIVDTYRCEWRDVVEDPEKRRFFQQFMNTDETESSIEIIDERGQSRPIDWAKDPLPLADLTLPDGRTLGEVKHAALEQPAPRQWVLVGTIADFPAEGGGTIKYGKVQIAVFHFASRNEWYATQNMCPHRFAFVLSRGIVGDQQGEPKVSCPLHKRNFSLQTGACLTDDQTPAIETFPIRIEGDAVWLELPPTEELDTRLATGLFCNGGTAASTCSSHQPVALQTPELVATL